MKRRSLLLGSLATTAGLAWLLRPREKGEDHSSYFRSLSVALDSDGRSKPTLVIDRKSLIANIEVLSSHLKGRFDYRIVAKSLPSLPLLEAVMHQTGSNRLMLFHQPFVNRVAAHLPQSDVLLGKPMPVAAARNFYRQFAGGDFNPARQLRWLLDTPERVAQYAELASGLGQDMLVCIELDVGLRRGGVGNDQQLTEMLDLISQSPRLKFSGMMGYEPHVTKVPGDPVKYRDEAMRTYKHYIELARQTLGEQWPADVLLNAGGSPTYQMYNTGDFPFNEISTGSCLVKPTDFDMASLADHRPASYIATPVLKSMDTLQIPGIDLGGLQAMWDPNRAKTFFTYGGYWKAKPESPSGLSTNPLFGRSTNQEMLNGSRNIHLRPDDWVFLRPTQSEFVFLQFGNIAVYEDGAIVERWPVFSEESA
ncbi:MAG: DSD1 family PLP-dependent enzyme [Halieaceae bacterium]|jgi:D-serine deaminase-like pyridoxal phosphate-dependent protein|nr:DSD1 family PLP-dependent enzyme [Halieaceae bacterium]